MGADISAVGSSSVLPPVAAKDKEPGKLSERDLDFIFEKLHVRVRGITDLSDAIVLALKHHSYPAVGALVTDLNGRMEATLASLAILKANGYPGVA